MAHGDHGASGPVATNPVELEVLHREPRAGEDSVTHAGPCALRYSTTMPSRPLLLLGLLLVGCQCHDRTIDDPPPLPDIEGMCRTYCERVMECLWTPESPVSFSTVEQCEHNCRVDVNWDNCPDVQTDMLECINGYECPKFAEFGRGCHDDDPATGHCCEEIAAQSGPCY